MTIYAEYSGEFRVSSYASETSEERTRRRSRRAGPNFRINKRLVEADKAEDVLEIVAKDLTNFNFVNISTCMYRLALVAQPLTPLHREHVRKDVRLLGLLKEITDTLIIDSASIISGSSVVVDGSSVVVLSPKEVSNLVWAATKLGISDSEFFSAVGASAVRHMAEYDSVNISLTLWGFAKMNQRHDLLFHTARSRVLSLLPAFEPHRLCNTVWAYAKFSTTITTTNTTTALSSQAVNTAVNEKREEQEFFKRTAEEAYRKSGKFNTSNESMLLYSLALAGCYHKPLFDRFLGRMERAIGAGDLADPRSLSNLVWAVVQVGKHHEYIAIVTAIVDSTLGNINRYSLTHLATLLGALKRAGAEKGGDATIDELVTKAFDQTKAKYQGDVPFENAVSKDDVETLRGVFKDFQLPDFAPDPVPVLQSAGVQVAKTKKITSVVYDVVGTIAIGLVLMGLLELVRSW